MPLYVYITLYFIHSLVDGHWGCFHFLTIVSNAIMDIYEQGTARLFPNWQYHFTFLLAVYEGTNFSSFLLTFSLSDFILYPHQ